MATKIEIIKFEKPNCAPCNAVSHFLDNSKLKYEKVNYIAAMDLATSFGVRTVPTVVVFQRDENGVVSKVHNQISGADPVKYNEFIQDVENLLSNYSCQVQEEVS